tara:strand:+ start:1846 stop:1986 length:141 start_codon:yes stop_codon:yes gene_type:complete
MPEMVARSSLVVIIVYRARGYEANENGHRDKCDAGDAEWVIKTQRI